MADWKRLKDMRTSQGFACTSCQLSDGPQKKKRNKNKKKMTSAAGRLAAEEDQHEQQPPPPPPPLDWDEEMERQMDESRRLFREHVRLESDRYKRQKAQWRHKKSTQRTSASSTRSTRRRKVNSHKSKKVGGVWMNNRTMKFHFFPPLQL